MNRATADNQSAQSEEEGLEPTKEWVKDLVDEIIADEFSSPDLELHWLDEDADAAGLEASLEGRVKLGAVTLNEMRDSLGLDPYANAAADRPMVLTPTGFVPIEANAGGKGANTLSTNAQTMPAVAKRSLLKDFDPDQSRVSAGNPDGGQWTSDGASGSSSGLTNGSEPNGASRPLQYVALDTGARTNAANAGAADANSSDNGVVAGDIVTPRGFTVQRVPGQDPLDPQGLNEPMSADEQQKIADVLTLIVNGDTSPLQPHPYGNLPHHVTGAVLPESTASYTAYDVPGLGAGRGEGRLLVDNATGAIYYTNNHYLSFYPIQLHPRGE